jgi:hypothetical protein
MAQDEPRLPLTLAQCRAAAELPWYRAWLLSTGRAEAELEPDAALSDSFDQWHAGPAR